MIDQICNLFTKFAKYGNPTPDSSLGVIWPQYNNTSKNYMEIGEKITTGENLDASSLEFWKTVYDYAGLEF
ncbi:unnamed protein product, partial [Iphiclides podalirius]